MHAESWRPDLGGPLSHWWTPAPALPRRARPGWRSCVSKTCLLRCKTHYRAARIGRLRPGVEGRPGRVCASVARTELSFEGKDVAIRGSGGGAS
jgi:hypothetical protein